MDGTNIGFSDDDLRMIIGLCNLDHKVTDLLGPRERLEESIQHRYRVSALAAKANIYLQSLIAEKIESMKISSASE
jgi:hypothetical protein